MNHRIRFEKLFYPVQIPSGTKVLIQRYWDRLVFFTE